MAYKSTKGIDDSEEYMRILIKYVYIDGQFMMSMQTIICYGTFPCAYKIIHAAHAPHSHTHTHTCVFVYSIHTIVVFYTHPYGIVFGSIESVRFEENRTIAHYYAYK